MTGMDSLDSITDNWLLQHVAEVLTHSVDPLTEASVMTLDQGESLVNTALPVGALQLASLGSVLEQLVLCDRLFVMHGWLSAWQGRHKSLDTIISTAILRTLDEQHPRIEALQERYNAEFCHNPAIQAEHELAQASYRNGTPVYSGQLINGTAGYLALADETHKPYWPHPARALFLQHSLYNRAPRHLVFTSLESRVAEARERYAAAISGRPLATALSFVLPALAYLCIMESGPGLTPIDVALQLRDDPDIRRLRDDLRRAVASHRDDPKHMETIVRSLADGVQAVERRLPTSRDSRALADVTFTLFAGGPAFKLPINAPRTLGGGAWPPPRHTAILTRLVQAGTLPLHQIVSKGLGVSRKTLVDGVVSLNSMLAESSPR